MNRAFKNYLVGVGTTASVWDRVDKLLAVFSVLCPERVDDIFVSEYINDAGERQLESLWGFSQHFMLETKQFLTQDNFDIAPLLPIHWVELTAKDYDFTHATEASRLSVQGRGAHELVVLLKGSRANCDALKTIVLKYFVRQGVALNSADAQRFGGRIRWASR